MVQYLLVSKHLLSLQTTTSAFRQKVSQLERKGKESVNYWYSSVSH